MTSKLSSHELPDHEIEFALPPGTKLLHGQYVIERYLNSGGFGTTYLAKDSLHRQVVIKECYPESICGRSSSAVRVRSRSHETAFRKIVDLFIEEARKLARLSHPNIVGVHQVFEDNETAYMALDFVEGRDLQEIIESSRTFKPEVFEDIVVKLLDAVEFIHNEGILHRDISPDNILLSTRNEPVLIDFGAARETVSRATRYLGGMQAVKDGYSPQEFYVADADQGPSSDLYALGASLYHVMTKNIPPHAQARLAAVASRGDDPYISIKTLVSGYSEPFLDSIDRVLNVLPKDRIQTAAEWRGLLTQSRITNRTRGTVSRPTLAVDNKNVIMPSGDVTPKKVSKNRKRVGNSKSEGNPESRSRPRSAQSKEFKLRGNVSSQSVAEAESLAKSLREQPSSNKNLFLGVAAVALLAVAGAGSYYMFGTSEEDNPVNQIATAPIAPEVTEDIAVIEPVLPFQTAVANEETATGLTGDGVETPLVEDFVVAVPTTTVPDTPFSTASDDAEIGAIVPSTDIAAGEGERVALELLASVRPVRRPDSRVANAEGQPVVAVSEDVPVLDQPTISDFAPYQISDLEIANWVPAALPVDTSAVAVSLLSDADPSRRLAVAVSVPDAGLAPSLITDIPDPPAARPDTVAAIDVSSVLTGKSVEFSVVADANDPTVVVSADGLAADVLKPGYRVMSVNGRPIASLSEFQEVVNATSVYSVGETVSVTFGLEDPATGETFVRSLDLPTAQETTLLNGVQFLTMRDGDSWTTTVANGTGEDQSELQNGDKIVAFLPANELINSPNALASVMRREIQNGSTQFNFAVNRDGEMWFVTLQYEVADENLAR